jgi:hypothetical protein
MINYYIFLYGSGAGGAGDTRPWIRIKAGVFQKIS